MMNKTKEDINEKKDIYYSIRSNDPKYFFIYGERPLRMMPGVTDRITANLFAKHKANKEGWSDFWVEETTVITTMVKI